MQKVLAAAKKIAAAALPILALLKKPGVAAAVVGYATPVILGVLGDNFNVAVLVPYLAAVGGVATGLQKLLAKPAPAPAPAPTPAPAPAPAKAKAPVKPRAKKAGGK